MKKSCNRKKADKWCNAVEQDEHFAYIAGFTEGGCPYGITWEQQAEIGAQEARRASLVPVQQLRPVSLAELVQEMEVVTDEVTVYFQRSTGEFFPVTDEQMLLAASEESSDRRPEWEQEIIQLCREIERDDDDFVALPSRFDIHEYSIMHDFCSTLEDMKKRQALLRSISGKGAFRKFKVAIHQYALEKAWYAFRGEVYKSIAQGWCEDHNVLWTD